MVMMNIKLVQRGVNSKLNGIGPVPVTHPEKAARGRAPCRYGGFRMVGSVFLVGEQRG